MKSIRQKREIIARQKEEKQKADKRELHDSFTEIQLQKVWNDYSKHLKKHGNKILASILDSKLPTVEGDTIKFVVSNNTMKADLKKTQGKLMKYIQKQLNNTDIQLEIEVNKKLKKKYAFTPQEKYEKLKEKNSLIEELRKTFDLDV